MIKSKNVKAPNTQQEYNLKSIDTYKAPGI